MKHLIIREKSPVHRNKNNLSLTLSSISTILKVTWTTQTTTKVCQGRSVQITTMQIKGPRGTRLTTVNYMHKFKNFKKKEVSIIKKTSIMGSLKVTIASRRRFQQTTQKIKSHSNITTTMLILTIMNSEILFQIKSQLKRSYKRTKMQISKEQFSSAFILTIWLLSWACFRLRT